MSDDEKLDVVLEVATHVLNLVLGLQSVPAPADAADALALAICHIWRAGPQARLDAAVAAASGGAPPPRRAGRNRS